MSNASRRQESRFLVSDEERERFQRDGWVHLPGVLSEEELVDIESVYDRFTNRDIPVAGRDFCDMSGDYDRDAADFSIINVMLPRRYHREWRGNMFEQRADSIAEQLCGPDMVIDYDQLLAKRPGRSDAVFGWHQDLAYWFETPDPRTATLWLALDDSTVANGCMRFISGSHREAALRPHRPLHENRDKSHTLITEIDEVKDEISHAEIRRGDCTVHQERVVHGSGGNDSVDWRRAYIVAFRSRDTVEEERRRGFTHSHEDGFDVIDSVDGMK